MSQFLRRLKLDRKAKSSSSDTAPLNASNINKALPLLPNQQSINRSATSSSHPKSYALDPPEEPAATYIESQSHQENVGPPTNAMDGRPQRNSPVVHNSIETDPIASALPSIPQEEHKSTWPKMAYSGFRIGLDLAAEVANSFTPLKSAVGTLSVLLNNYDQTVDNKKKVEELMLKIKSIVDSLVDSPDGEKVGRPHIHEYIEKEVSRRRKLKRTLDEVRQKLEELLSPHVFVRFLSNADQRSKIVDLVEDIREIMINYQTSLQRDLYEMNSDMYGMSREQIESGYFHLLRELPYAKAAGYRSGNRDPCLKGTRVQLLVEIEKWAADEKDHSVFWLNGIAGVGKTAVTQSFSERIFAEGRLGASFFCSRGVTDRSNIDLIFPTLAFQLASSFPEFRPIITKVIKDSPTVGHESVSHQLEQILVNPLQHLVRDLRKDPLNSRRLPIVLIIDALDECEDGRAESAILSVLATQLERIDSVKFFITSRPIDQIRAAFRRPKLDKLTRRLQLHKVDRATTNRDMRLFFRTRLPKEVENREDFTPPHPWPAESHVTSLVHNSDGLFIYASTILKFITSLDYDPDERLRLIITMVDTFFAGKLGLDQLYMQVLTCEFLGSEVEDPEVISDFRLVVGCILLAFNPLSRTSLANLLDQTPNYILRVLRHMHSVLIIPESASDLITASHKSFSDFLTNPSRCDDNRFYVDSSVHHAVLGIQCLKLMRKNLTESICSIPKYTLNKEVDDLPGLRQRCIGDALEYSCRFFGKHVRQAPTTGEDASRIIDLLRVVVENQLLPWLEVLSIVGGLRTAVHSLNDIKWWLDNAKVNEVDLVNSITDCHLFVLKIFDLIEESATYIYDFALPWCPISSPLRQRYGGELVTKAKVLKGLDSSWGQCSRTIGTGENTHSVTFSHDGRLVVGRGLSKVKIYEAVTGACLITIQDGADFIAISPDNTLIVSASGLDVKLWDIQTGELWNSVASGSRDQTIRIWDLSSGRCEAILECKSWVRSVHWCANENLVLYGLDDGTFNVGDVFAKTCIKTIPGHFPWSLEISPDRLRFASGSDDGTITIYDTQTLNPLKTFPVSGSVWSVSFSTTGDQIVYLGGDGVHMLDLQRESSVNIVFGDLSDLIWSAVLSPDGSTVASTSYDSINIWQCEESTAHRDDMSVRTGRICISADGQRVKSGLEDETIMIWSARTGECLETFQGRRHVHSMALSPTTSLVVSCYLDGQLRLWDYRDPNLNETAMCGIDHPDVQFSIDGAQVITPPSSWSSDERDNLFHERWEICLSPPGLRCLGRERFNPYGRPEILPGQLYRFSKSGEWIVDHAGRRACWVPPEHRNPPVDFSGSTVVLGTLSGEMAIVDLSNIRSVS